MVMHDMHVGAESDCVRVHGCAAPREQDRTETARNQRREEDGDLGRGVAGDEARP